MKPNTPSTNVSSIQMGAMIETLATNVIAQRRKWERKWFNNSFFDDGLHFKYVSKKTGQIIDHLGGMDVGVERAIPRASRQIRGVANLLKAADPYPVVYPERITMADYPMIPDPMTGQTTINPQYQQAIDESQKQAQRVGNWLTTEWNEQELGSLLTEMIILTAKHGISYLQTWSDPSKQKICTEVFDAFDLLLYGNYKHLKDLPFIIKAVPVPLSTIQTNSLYSEEAIKKLTSDNRYAASDIKESYMNMQFGNKTSGSREQTLTEKETFTKECLSDTNWQSVSKLAQGDAMTGKSKGDYVMRHTFSASGVTLLDEYVDLDEYPFADLRFEPGPLYQIPLIERFIPQNKSLDIVMTRLERWVNAMVVGIITTRKGENFQVSNFAGGQKVEYETTKPEQMQVASAGSTPFDLITLLDKYIEEQGASTAALGQLPNNVKSGVAIESLKSTEYANLKIPTEQLKRTIKMISERMIEVVDKTYMKPEPVYNMDGKNPDYFDIIGSKGAQASRQVDKALPDGTVQVKKSMRVRIEIEPGLGLTMDGKKQAMQQILDYMIKLSQLGFITPESVQVVVKKFMEVFGFGSTQEFMEALTNGTLPAAITDQDLMKMKIALAEVLKDTGVAGQQQQQQQVDTTKMGVVSALKDLRDHPNNKPPQPAMMPSPPPPPQQQPLTPPQNGVQ